MSTPPPAMETHKDIETALSGEDDGYIKPCPIVKE